MPFDTHWTWWRELAAILIVVVEFCFLWHRKYDEFWKSAKEYPGSCCYFWGWNLLIAHQVVGIRFDPGWTDDPRTMFQMCLLGIVLMLAGLRLWKWARRTMGLSFQAPATAPKSEAATLVTAGPFRYSRNPVYIAYLLIDLGMQIAVNSFLVVVVVLRWYNHDRHAQQEEEILTEHFGQEYADYMARTPRWLFV